MDSLLPVLFEDAPQMTTCAFCPQPGHCCRGFALTGEGFYRGVFPVASWEADAVRVCGEHGLDFHVIGAFLGEENKRGEAAPMYACNHLTEQGRCGIYEFRPPVCRRYVPARDKLCIFG